MDINLEQKDVIRFHRSAKPKLNRSKKLVAQTIVKFSNWKIRKAAHYANKKARTTGKAFRIHHDLTKRRYNLLAHARQQIEARFTDHNRQRGGPNTAGQDQPNETIENNESSGNQRDKIFAFADVNSNLLVRFCQETFPFNDERELEDILEQILEEIAQE